MVQYFWVLGKMSGFKEQVPFSRFFNRPRCQYQEMKARNLLYHVISKQLIADDDADRSSLMS